jgi:hypothetical protein
MVGECASRSLHAPVTNVKSAASRVLVVAALFALPPAAQKHPIRGLVTMGSLKFLHDGGEPADAMGEVNARPRLFAAAVINVAWSQLEPRRGVFDFSVVDRTVGEIRTYDKHYSATPIVGKLRVFAGVEAPRWVKTMEGAPVSYSRKGVREVTLGRFWSDGYRAEWRRLQDTLAARYDREPLIGEVAVSSCSADTDEPFITPMNPRTLSALQAAGMTDAKRKACLMDIAVDYAAWKSTPLDLTINPFRDADSGAPHDDVPFTRRMMALWRQKLGGRGVLANHALNAPPPHQLLPIYDELKRLGPPIALQTQSPKQITLENAIAYGLAYTPTEIEIWTSDLADGRGTMTNTQLKRWAVALVPPAQAAKR